MNAELKGKGKRVVMVDVADDEISHEDVARIANPPDESVKKRKKGGKLRSKKNLESHMNSQTEQDSDNNKKVAAKASPIASKRTPLKDDETLPPPKKKNTSPAKKKSTPKKNGNPRRMKQNRKRVNNLQAFHRKQRNRNFPVNQLFHRLQYPWWSPWKRCLLLSNHLLKTTLISSENSILDIILFTLENSSYDYSNTTSPMTENRVQFSQSRMVPFPSK